MAETELAFAGAQRQAELLAERQVSSPELVGLHLARIERLDPELNAFTRVLADRARLEAEQAQRRLDAGDREPLLGVPVAVKDNVDVAGEITSHGTGAAGEPVASDSEVVRRLRAAGAVVLGKTALPELAMWGHVTDSVSWGTTRNPWDPKRSPGGSSGGSAVAVAAGLAAAAVGSDGGASIRVPAGACGLFGLKPQRGRISLAPLHRHWYGLTVLGWLTRTVSDTAALLDAIAGPAPGDADVAPPPERPFAEAAASDPGRLRIAVSTEPVQRPMPLEGERRRAVEQTAELLAGLGHEVVQSDPSYPAVLRLGLPRYLAGVAADADGLVDRDRLEPRSRRIAALGRLARRRALRRSLAAEAEIKSRLAPLFEAHDVLLTPLVAQPMPPAARFHDRGALLNFLGMGPYITYTGVWNFTGQPAAAVPRGLDSDGMPIAVQLVGRANDEATLLSLAAQLEAARPWADRLPPLATR